MEYYDNKDNKLVIKLKLKEFENIIDISYMFFGCTLNIWKIFFCDAIHY